MKEKIDFVILWVDGGDAEWLKEKAKYNPNKVKKDGVDGAIRYRDWDNLKYWFRGVETFAPWVNNVYFITWGHLPKWLNTNHPQLKIIKHEDYIPKKYLPVFSSNPIELNINRIKELSEHFVLFNDDMFLINDVKPEDFFIDGLPVDNYNEVNLDMNKEDPVFASILKNNYRILSEHYNKRKVILTNPCKYLNFKYGFDRNIRTLKNTITKKEFVGVNNNHLYQPFLKSYFDRAWDIIHNEMDHTSSNRFRDKSDISQFLIRYFQVLDGKFIPKGYDYGRYFSVHEDNHEIIDYIEKQKGKCICINDTDPDIDFEKCKQEINNAFNKILSKKSKFEK